VGSAQVASDDRFEVGDGLVGGFELAFEADDADGGDQGHVPIEQLALSLVLAHCRSGAYRSRRDDAEKAKARKIEITGTGTPKEINV
jgi:hypothetical protein